MAEIYKGLPFDEYRKIDAVNSSLLKAFFRSPEHGHHAATTERESSDAFVIGGALHTLILEGREVFNDRYNPDGPINPRTGKCFGRGTMAFDHWAEYSGVNTHKILTDAEVLAVEGMASAIKEQPAVLQAIRDGNALREVTIVWDEPHAGGKVRCKMRADYLHPALGVLDVKTCQDCRADQFSRDVAKHGYDLQAALYVRGSMAAGLNPHGDFGWIAIEKAPPHLIGLWTPTDNALDTGYHNMRLALDRYLAWEAAGRTCQREQAQFRPLDLPAWARLNPVTTIGDTTAGEQEDE
jgi:hypothetical protein